MTTFSIVVDDSTEAKAATVAKRYGLDLEDVTVRLWKRMAEIDCIPFDLDGEPNEESLQAIRETEEIIAKGGDGRALQTIDDVIAELRS